ncbi:hypothetical protein ACIRG5_30200 [Lentzea sp. NPDC102401]
MSTVEELRQVLADIADTASTDAATAIRRRIAQIERDTVAQEHQQRR